MASKCPCMHVTGARWAFRSASYLTFQAEINVPGDGQVRRGPSGLPDRPGIGLFHTLPQFPVSENEISLSCELPIW
jgi:hypothetical protein